MTGHATSHVITFAVVEVGSPAEGNHSNLNTRKIYSIWIIIIGWETSNYIEEKNYIKITKIILLLSFFLIGQLCSQSSDYQHPINMWKYDTNVWTMTKHAHWMLPIQLKNMVWEHVCACISYNYRLGVHPVIPAPINLQINNFVS